MPKAILYHGLTKDCPTPKANGSCPGHPQQTEHTPGPWQVNHGKRGKLNQPESEWKPFTFVETNLVQNGPEATICEMKHGDSYGSATQDFKTLSKEDMEANAVLIAAAPDLLDALEHTARNLRSMIYMLPISTPTVEKQSLESWLKRCDAAIARARGL